MRCWPIWSLRSNPWLARPFLALFLLKQDRPLQGIQVGGDMIGIVRDALQVEENSGMDQRLPIVEAMSFLGHRDASNQGIGQVTHCSPAPCVLAIPCLAIEPP